MVWAQAEQGSGVAGKAQAVVIVMTDPSGTTVAGVQVRMAPVAENLPAKMETDAKGELALQLRPGVYEVVGEMPGFMKLPKRIDVKESGTEEIFTIVLEVGGEHPILAYSEIIEARAGVPQQGSGAGKAQAVVIVVKDPSGATVAGAQVRVAPVAENAPEKMETDEHGELKLQLQPGGHGVVVRDAGFAQLRAHIDVKADGKAQTFPVVLQIAATGGPTMVGAKAEAGVLTLTVAPFEEKFRITEEELSGMARKTVTVHNPHANADETYEGVELGELLMKYGAPMGKELRWAGLGYYVVATGADGYKRCFRWRRWIRVFILGMCWWWTR